MSIKIQSAYQTRSMSMHGFQKWCEQLRGEALHVAERGFASYLAKEICRQLDAHTLGFEPIEDHGLSSIKSSIISSALSERPPYEANWTLRLRVLADSRFTYIMADYRYNHFTSIFRSKTELRSFDYQNSSDCLPDGVSAQEWDVRARTWRRLLSKGSIGERGVEACIVDKHSYCFPPNSLLRRLLPTPADRSAAITMDHEIHMKCIELEHLYSNKPALLYREAKRQIESTQNRQALGEKIAHNATLLADLSALLT